MACMAVSRRRFGVQIQAWRLVGACRSTSAYSENKISGNHKGFYGVLFSLWLLANTWYKDAQLLVVAWTANRWCPVACAGQLLMALFTRAAKLDPGANGARWVRTKAINHSLGISRQRNSGCRPSRVNIMAQGFSTSLSRSLP